MRYSMLVLVLSLALFIGPAALASDPPDSCYDEVTMCDANGNGACDIDDCVYLLWYIFMWGPAPTPYALASGDGNCDCQVDIDDVLHGICYIFECGGPSCTCDEWQAACGPLR